jgi:diguanylate cyclase
MRETGGPLTSERRGKELRRAANTDELTGLANRERFRTECSFVSPMMQDESDLIIVRSTINLGHDLGLKVIADGVEDELTLKRLATLGCDLAQGYHLSRPLTPDAFSGWIADNALLPRAA